MPESKVGEALKAPPWLVKKTVARAKKADRAALERAICVFADLEIDMRGGGDAPARRGHRLLARAGPRRGLSVPVIRAARSADAQAVADIYNEGIETRLATFETEPRSAPEVEAWLGAGERLPLLVAEEDDDVLGWARILGLQRPPGVRGRGGGVGLRHRAGARPRPRHGLLEALPAAGRASSATGSCVGKLFTANAASAAMVRRCGWREVGMHHRHSRLDGEWRDVLVVERVL